MLISDAERSAFLALHKDYQRDAFVRRFWEVRDPHRETARNELAESWKERAKLARERFGDLANDRARMLLVLGEPQQTFRTSCIDFLRPLEIWSYERSDRVRGPFSIVFFSATGSLSGAMDLWYPGQGVEPLVQVVGDLFGRPNAVFEAIRDRCSRGDEILAGLSTAVDWERLAKAMNFPPKPGEEWLKTFTAFSTELPPGAESLAARVELSFPGRYQSRTVVQGLVLVDAGENTTSSTRTFVLDGDVLRGDDLFEHFRYRFQLRPDETTPAGLPMVFQRNLRPGSYQLILKLEDIDRGAFYREERALVVPSLAEQAVTEAAPAAPVESAGTRTVVRLAEANQTLREDVSLRLLEPPPGLRVGRTRFEADVTGAGVNRVRFFLNGKAVLAKAQAPYSAELDLGSMPRLHRLRAVALDAEDRELAADEILVNSGPHRFGVRLIEPRPGGQYDDSVRVRAVVDVPEGDDLDRVEILLDDKPQATLFQPPFTHPILLPKGGGSHFVLVRAHLADGSYSEDSTLINAPGAAEVVRVNFVELYTAVLDRRGRPVEGMKVEQFEVKEDGVRQEIRRFELVKDLPIHAGVVLDTSASMVEELPDATRAALDFFERVLTPRDRAAVITFNNRPSLAVRFTRDRETLVSGVSGLKAEGETALYDALAYGLYYFSGLSGKRALILLSDGEDVGSRYRYDEVVEYARQSGVAIYVISLEVGSRQQESWQKLRRLADETGGQAFQIRGVHQLGRVYGEIEAEIRAQYLLAYQSSNTASGQQFREVEVRVDGAGLEAKTVRGYYP